MSHVFAVIGIVLAAWFVLDCLFVLVLAIGAPTGCDACQGVNDCPSCGPVKDRPRT